MKKLYVVAFSLLFSLVALGCASLGAHFPNRNNSSNFFQREKLYDSIVKVENSIRYEKCKIESDGGLGECVETKNKFSSGSGFAIAKKGTPQTNMIGTAGHVCQLPPSQKARMRLGAILKGYLVRDIKVVDHKVIHDNGEKVKAHVKSSEFSKIDACLLEVKRSFPALHLAKKRPKRGKRYFTAGSPLGINGEEMTFLTSGLYSGTKEIRGSKYDWYSIPSIGGQSGSPIMNRKGNIVGVLTLGIRGFDEISISPKFSRIHYFFSTNL